LKVKKNGKKVQTFPPKKNSKFFIADKIIEEKKKIPTNHNFVVNASKNLKRFEKV
jgi:hypothetical protein